MRQAVGRFLDYLCVECGLAANTLAAYRRDLAKFAEFCAQAELLARQVEPGHIQRFLIALKNDGLAVSSIARHLTATRMFLRWCWHEGLLDRDITTVIDSPRTWQRLPNVLNADRVQQLLAAPTPADPLYLRDRAILELLYATGVRVAELMGLRGKDINHQIGYARVLGKGNKERIVPVGRPALAALAEYTDRLRPTLDPAGTAEALLLSRRGRPLDRGNVWRLVVKYARRTDAGPRVSPHSLRHCFATHLLSGGADLRVVQELLGHASVATTQIYTHVDHSRLKSIHRKYHPRQ